MAYLQKYLDHFLDDERFDVYWQALNTLSAKAFDLAVENLVKTFVPTNSARFPYVAQFLENCNEAGPRRAHNAITLLRKTRTRISAYDSVSFGDSSMHYLVESFGGWNSVVTMDTKRWDVNEGRMLEAYRSAELFHPQAGNHLAGLAELDEGFFSLFIVHGDLKNKLEIRCRYKIPDGILPEPENYNSQLQLQFTGTGTEVPYGERT
jgi:hypothetical protein